MRSIWCPLALPSNLSASICCRETRLFVSFSPGFFHSTMMTDSHLSLVTAINWDEILKTVYKYIFPSSISLFFHDAPKGDIRLGLSKFCFEMLFCYLKKKTTTKSSLRLSFLSSESFYLRTVNQPVFQLSGIPYLSLASTISKPDFPDVGGGHSFIASVTDSVSKWILSP